VVEAAAALQERRGLSRRASPCSQPAPPDRPSERACPSSWRWRPTRGSRRSDALPPRPAPPVARHTAEGGWCLGRRRRVAARISALGEGRATGEGPERLQGAAGRGAGVRTANRRAASASIVAGSEGSAPIAASHEERAASGSSAAPCRALPAALAAAPRSLAWLRSASVSAASAAARRPSSVSGIDSPRPVSASCWSKAESSLGRPVPSARGHHRKLASGSGRAPGCVGAA